MQRTAHFSTRYQSNAMTKQIVIIGGGVAGLTAALHLAERGLRPLLLEAHPDFPGGRLAGGEMALVDGRAFRLEHGVHGVWRPYVQFKAMLARYGADPGLTPSPDETWLHRHRGRTRRADVGRAIRRSWIPAPLHYLALFMRPRFLQILGWRDWLRLPFVWYGLIFALGLDPLREQQPLAGLSLAAYTQRWSPAVRSFCIGLARNSLSATPEEIPLSGFIAFLRYYTLLRRDAWEFDYLPADGGTALIDPLVAKLQEMGGRLQLGTAVTHLEPLPDGWRMHTADGQTITAAHVVLATDPAEAVQILQRSPALAAVATGLHWPEGRETAVIRLWFKRAPHPHSSAASGLFTGDFTADNFFWLHRLQTTYRQWHEETGGSAVEIHIYGPGTLLQQPDAALLAHVIADVQTAFPELRGQLMQQHLQRNTVPHTLFSIGAAGQHLEVQTPWPGLYACGDWVYHPAPAFFLERAALTGLVAANAILQAEGLPPFALADYPPPEPFAGFVEKLMLHGRQRARGRVF